MQSNVVQNIQVAGLAAYVRFVHRTSRVVVSGTAEGSSLVTFWHDGILALLAATVGTKNVAVYIRAQPHIQDTLELLAHLEIPTFVSDHRGTAGVKAARRWLSTPGRLLAVTADPVQPLRVEPGVARLARMLDVPLRPLAVTASHGYRLDRLDRGVVPYVGGRLNVSVLPSVHESSLEETAAAVQRALPTDTLTGTAAPSLVPWRRALAAWPLLCLMPRTRGKLTVWPATEPTSITF
jgi:lysophospholipid acyltransferase (LPLAT)-like uncharacterized protein